MLDLKKHYYLCLLCLLYNSQKFRAWLSSDLAHEIVDYLVPIVIVLLWLSIICSLWLFTP